MHYRLGECLSTLRGLGYRRSSDLHAPIRQKQPRLFLGQRCRDPTRNGIGHWFEIFTPILIPSPQPNRNPSFASKRRRLAGRPRLLKFWQSQCLHGNTGQMVFVS
jgi:hypothetical protein